MLKNKKGLDYQSFLSFVKEAENIVKMTEKERGAKVPSFYLQEVFDSLVEKKKRYEISVKPSHRDEKFISYIFNLTSGALKKAYSAKKEFTSIDDAAIESATGEMISYALKKEREEGLMSDVNFRGYVFASTFKNLNKDALTSCNGSLISLQPIRFGRDSKNTQKLKKEALQSGVSLDSYEDVVRDMLVGDTSEASLLHFLEVGVNSVMTTRVLDFLSNTIVLKGLMMGNQKKDFGVPYSKQSDILYDECRGVSKLTGVNPKELFETIKSSHWK